MAPVATDVAQETRKADSGADENREQELRGDTADDRDRSSQLEHGGGGVPAPDRAREGFGGGEDDGHAGGDPIDVGTRVDPEVSDQEAVRPDQEHVPHPVVIQEGLQGFVELRHACGRTGPVTGHHWPRAS